MELGYKGGRYIIKYGGGIYEKEDIYLYFTRNPQEIKNEII